MQEKLTVEIVESSRTRAGKEFVDFPHRLYRGCAQWVPQFRRDIRMVLDRRHPSFDHVEARFFIARKNGQVAGTIAAIDNA